MNRNEAIAIYGQKVVEYAEEMYYSNTSNLGLFHELNSIDEEIQEDYLAEAKRAYRNEITIYMKSPDSLEHAMDGLSDSQKKNFKELCEKWFDYGECISLTVNLEDETIRIGD